MSEKDLERYATQRNIHADLEEEKRRERIQIHAARIVAKVDQLNEINQQLGKDLLGAHEYIPIIIEEILKLTFR